MTREELIERIERLFDKRLFGFQRTPVKNNNPKERLFKNFLFNVAKLELQNETIIHEPYLANALTDVLGQNHVKCLSFYTPITPDTETNNGRILYFFKFY